MTTGNGSRMNGQGVQHSHADSPYGGIIDPIIANQRNQLINNQMQFQRGFLQSLVDPRRSIEDECGFPPLGSQVDVNLYRMLYDRDAIANRAVRVIMEECFQVHPKVYDSEEEAEEPTPFENAVDSLGQKLGPDGKSWYKDEEGSVVNEILKRAAILSRIGKFGVLLLGINDGRNLQEPVAGVVTVNSEGQRVLRHPFAHGWHDSPAATFNEETQEWQLLSEHEQKFTVTTNVTWSWKSVDGEIDLNRLRGGDASSIGQVINQLINRRPPQLVCECTEREITYRPSQYERHIVSNTCRLIANHRQLETDLNVNRQEYEPYRTLTCNEAVSITNGKGPTTKQAFSLGGTGNPNNAAPPSPALGTVAGAGVSGAGSSPPPGAFVSGTDAQYAKGGGNAPNYKTSPASTSPGLRSNNPQYDKSNSWQDHGIGMPPAALSGTDQQYFGVQYGPSEMLSDKPLPSGDNALHLVFLRAYSEDLVQIVRYEWNIFNPRFGLPVMYRITLNDPRDMSSGGVGLPMATVFVHWSRVVHIAFERNSSEIFSPPALQPILNNVLGLHKLYGAGPEMFWKGAFPGFSFETNPQLGGDVLIDVPALLNMYEQYQNSLQRALVTSGMTVKSMAPAVSDPTPFIEGQIEAICIQKQMPNRVFMGTERGELASSQDDEKWNDRVKCYQLTELNPHLIFPFYDRLIQLGILPEPGAGNDAKGDEEGEPTSNTKEGLKQRAIALIRNLNSMTPREFTRAVKSIRRGLQRLTSNVSVPPQFIKDKPPTDKPAGDKADEGLPTPKDKNTATMPSSQESSKDDPDKLKGYGVEWPSMDSQSDMDKATIALTKTQAAVAYGQGGEAVIPRQFWLTHFMGFDEREAQAIMDEAEKQQQEQQDQAADLADEHGMEPTGIDPATGKPTGFEKPQPKPPPGVGMPGGPPHPPQKLGAGQSLVHPQTGKTIAKGPPPPKPPTLGK